MTLRCMTYNVNGCRGADGRLDADRIRQVLSEAAPEVAALQEVIPAGREDYLPYLAERLGMYSYRGEGGDGNAFLSSYPLRGVRSYHLGGQGCCLRADLDIRGKRVHLFNLRLSPVSSERRLQFARLLGPEILGQATLVCPTLLLGDFAAPAWGLPGLHLKLRRAGRRLGSATFPSRFPLFARDRAYLRGDIRVLESRVLHSPEARHASSHLPLVLTLRIFDPGCYLRVKELQRNRMEIAPS